MKQGEGLDGARGKAASSVLTLHFGGTQHTPVGLALESVRLLCLPPFPVAVCGLEALRSPFEVFGSLGQG